MAINQNLFSQLLKSFAMQEGLDELLSMCEHWNGYKRETAVRRLGMFGNPLALPKLLIRANDWVPQVRVAARNAILRLAVPINAKAFVQCLPELYHLRNCGRDNHDELIRQIESFLLAKNNATHLIQGINHKNPFVVRRCVELVIKKRLLRTSEFVNTCLKHSDLIVRVKVSYLLRKLEGPEQDSALAIALKDRFMPIRREAFQLILKKEENHTLAKKFLFDHHSSLREIAIIYLKQAKINVKSIYQISLKSEQLFVLRSAIWGLAELQSVENIPQLNPFLQNPHPSVRKYAVNALARLDGSNAKNILVTGLLDDSSSVCKEAARLVKKHYISFTVNDLFKIVNGSQSLHTWIACVTISKQINKWDRLIFLLHLLRIKYLDNPKSQKCIKIAIHQWDLDFNKNGTLPTKAQINELNSQCKKVIDILKSYEYRTLLFTLKYFKIV